MKARNSVSNSAHYAVEDEKLQNSIQQPTVPDTNTRAPEPIMTIFDEYDELKQECIEIYKNIINIDRSLQFGITNNYTKLINSCDV